MGDLSLGFCNRRRKKEAQPMTTAQLEPLENGGHSMSLNCVGAKGVVDKQKRRKKTVLWVWHKVWGFLGAFSVWSSSG